MSYIVFEMILIDDNAHILSKWFETQEGLAVEYALSEALSSVYDRLSGTTLLQLGDYGENVWLEGFKQFRTQWFATPSSYSHTHVVTAWDTLPFASRTFDCLIVPFVMELLGFHVDLLHEFDRVLKAMGHIVFMGVNPLSLWNLAFHLGWVGSLSSVHTVSSWSIRHAMLRMGYRQRLYETCYCLPPVHHAYLIDKLKFLNQMGKMMIFPGGFYCMVFQKFELARPKRMRFEKYHMIPAVVC